MKTVLIVDDEKHTREDLEIEFTDNFQVYLASSVLETRNFVEQAEFDFAIIDLKLDHTSEVGGIEIFNTLKDHGSKAKIVIISGFPFGHIKEKLFKQVKEDYASELEENYVYKGGQENYIDAVLNKLGISQERWWGNYHALLISVQDYANKSLNLTYPRQDADKLAETLTTLYKFEPQNIHRLCDPTRTEIIRELDKLSEKLTENDSLLIFYAGHGRKDDKNGKGYWMAQDFSLQKPETWLSHADVRDWIARIPSKHVLLISDSCFSGTFCELRGKEEAKLSYREQYEHPCRIVVSSGNPHETVLDDSVFLKSILDYLTNTQEPLFGAQTMFAVIEPTVSTEVEKLRPEGQGQHPLCQSLADAGKHDKKGDFIFIRR